ncbi:MAG: methyltransferase domain-containing protein [Thermoplasmatales archaeon]|nr:methyltransferase domain-containing protein [Thermoplasmatales archaeon]
MYNTPRRLWIKSLIRFLQIYFNKSEGVDEIIGETYNQIANDYDTTWTVHMQNLSMNMVKRLSLKGGDRALDLACGTGFVTSKLSKYTKTRVVGVDVSEGMINVAKEKYGEYCDFILADMMNFLYNQPSNSFDIITCAWGLGYTCPLKFIREISRVLKPGGRVGIIDLSIFSNYEIYLFSLLTIVEKPDAIFHPIRAHYLSSYKTLNLRMKFSGIHILDSWKSYKVISFEDAEAAVEQLIRTGTLAIFESILKEEYKGWFKDRLKQIIQKKYEKRGSIPLKHHYIASIGMK